MAFCIKSSANCIDTIKISNKEYSYFDINKAASSMKFDISVMPISIKVIFENLLRFEDGKKVTSKDFAAISKWYSKDSTEHEIAYMPARVLMQDFTGVPAIVDLAMMRDYVREKGGDINAINPLIPVDLVIDHSVQIDSYGRPTSLNENVMLEMHRNAERYKFLKWGQNAFRNFSVVPPGNGICHQVNLEYLAKGVWTSDYNGATYAYPDTLVGTDSHTTMINGLGILGWGVGGIEAEAAMLGQPISMLIPEVVGFNLTGMLHEGVTATDLVLTITNILRKKGVVGKFVEFYGRGLKHLTLADRATIANMAPEYGATCGFFPIDDESVKYMELSGRSSHEIELVTSYCKKQGLWGDDSIKRRFNDTVELDISSVVPSVAGPKRPQDRINLSDVKRNFAESQTSMGADISNIGKEFEVEKQGYALKNGDVVIAAITSCTNTSNPSVMIGAGILARKAVKLGLKSKPWVKTSLAPGSQVVSEYLKKADLQQHLDSLGFNIVGYGCTTCIGNSGPLKPEIDAVINDNKLVVAAVLSGNRNFEGRVHPSVRANYLASPILCVAYAIAGTVEIDFEQQPIGVSKEGKEVYLRDIWPTSAEIDEAMTKSINPEMFKAKYAKVFDGDTNWRDIDINNEATYEWDDGSTYIKLPPFLKDVHGSNQDIKNAEILAIFGDSITTDHISPAGSIGKNTPAGSYLLRLGVSMQDFNSYGARRGNHEVMMRGTFANVRIKNELLNGVEGGYTKVHGHKMNIYDAAMQYMENRKQLVIIAGKEYGTGSSRDWAAKGTKLLGVNAVIAESFERIHRSNLVGMGVIPLIFKGGMSRKDLDLQGGEHVSIAGLESIYPFKEVECTITRDGIMLHSFKLICRVDTEIEVEYIKSGGIMPYVLKTLMGV